VIILLLHVDISVGINANGKNYKLNSLYRTLYANCGIKARNTLDIKCNVAKYIIYYSQADLVQSLVCTEGLGLLVM